MSKTKINAHPLLGKGNIQHVKFELKPPAMHGIGLMLGTKAGTKAGLNLLIFTACGK